MNILTAAFEAFRELNPNISVTQCLVFIGIAENERLSVNELQDRLGVKAATLKRSVDALEKLGLVKRQASSRRKRSSLVCLTDPGRELVSQLNRMFLDYANGYGQAVVEGFCQHTESLLNSSDNPVTDKHDEDYLHRSFEPKKQQLEETVGKVIKLDAAE